MPRRSATTTNAAPVAARTRSAIGSITSAGSGEASPATISGIEATVRAIATEVWPVRASSTRLAWTNDTANPATTVSRMITICSTKICVESRWRSPMSAIDGW